MKVVFCTLVLSIYSFLAKGQTQESPSFFISEKGLVLSHPVATTFNGKCYLAFEQETANGLQKAVVKSIKL
jgi:hypothetical protein